MNTTVLDRFLSPFADCLTSEVAQRIVNLQLDSQSQARLDELAAKANEGQLTDDAREEYEEFVEGIDLIGIFKARAPTTLLRNKNAPSHCPLDSSWSLSCLRQCRRHR